MKRGGRRQGLSLRTAIAAIAAACSGAARGTAAGPRVARDELAVVTSLEDAHHCQAVNRAGLSVVVPGDDWRVPLDFAEDAPSLLHRFAKAPKERSGVLGWRDIESERGGSDETGNVHRLATIGRVLRAALCSPVRGKGCRLCGRKVYRWRRICDEVPPFVLRFF